MFATVFRNTAIFLLIGILAFSCFGCNEIKETSEVAKIENQISDMNESDSSQLSENSNSAVTTSSKKKHPSKNQDKKKNECRFHNFTSWKSADEYFHSSKCLNCGKIEKIKHIWNDGVVVVKPTESVNGTIKYTCQICADTKTEEIGYTTFFGDEYSTGRKTAEVYRAASTRKFKLLGAAYSENDFAALYGECPIGLGVLVQTEDGCFNVDSNMGNFALRMKSAKSRCEMRISLWYKGKPIMKNRTETINIITSDYHNNTDGLKPIIGYDNLGFFKSIFYTSTNELTVEFDDNGNYHEAYEAAILKFKNRVQALQEINPNAEIIAVLAPCSLSAYSQNSTANYGCMCIDIYSGTKFLLEDTGVTIIDLISTFVSHKNDKLPLFNKNDTSWTDYGAYIAYVELYKHISKKFPMATPRKFSDFKWNEDYFYGGNIPAYFGIDKQGKKVSDYTVRREMPDDVPQVIKNINRFKLKNSITYNSLTKEAIGKRIYKTDNPDLPNVSLIRNSYGVQIQDLISERSNVSVINAVDDYKFDIEQYKNYDIWCCGNSGYYYFT